MRPRIALSAVVFPAPLGPISPRMRPSSTRKSTPSRATVAPKALRRPAASMHVMASAILLVGGAASQQFFRFQAEPPDRCVDPRPFLRKKLLIWSEAENRIERGGLPRAVGTDQSEDAALFHAQIDAIEGHGCAEGLAKAGCFDACHGFSDPPRWRSRVSAVLSVSGRASGSLRRSSAIPPKETSDME